MRFRRPHGLSTVPAQAPAGDPARRQPRPRRLALLAVAAVAAVPLLAPASADASAAPHAAGPGVYKLLNDLQSLQCLAGRSNNKVQISNCVDAFTDQIWTLQPASAAGYYRLRVRQTDKCLAFPNGNGSNGTQARISDCVDSFDDQWWTLDPTLASDAFQLRNFHTGKCLVARNLSSSATESDCVLNFRDQWWHFFPHS